MNTTTIIAGATIAAALTLATTPAGAGPGADEGLELADTSRPHSVNAGGSESLIIWCGLVPHTVVIHNTRDEHGWVGWRDHQVTSTGLNPPMSRPPAPGTAVVVAVTDGATTVELDWGGGSNARLDFAPCDTHDTTTPTTAPTPTTIPTTAPTPTTAVETHQLGTATNPDPPTPTTTAAETHQLGTATNPDPPTTNTPPQLPATGGAHLAPLAASLALIATGGAIHHTSTRIDR